MKIISIINYKGGVGKTTVTSNFAAEMASRGFRVLLLDMDAQSSLTFSFVAPDFWKKELSNYKTIKSYFDKIIIGQTPPPLSNFVIRPENVNTRLKYYNSNGFIDLIPSHLALINIDLELAQLLGGASMDQSKTNYLKVHGQLRKDIGLLAKDYDIVLIDCPPNFNIVTKNALIASDQILVPAKPDYLSTLGIDYLHRNVKQLVSDFNEYAALGNIQAANPCFLGVIFTMIQIHNDVPIAAQKQFISQTSRLNIDIPVFRNYFRENKSIFSGAPESGIPVVLSSYSNKTYTDIVNEAKELVNEFFKVSGIQK